MCSNFSRLLCPTKSLVKYTFFVRALNGWKSFPHSIHSSPHQFISLRVKKGLTK